MNHLLSAFTGIGFFFIMTFHNVFYCSRYGRLDWITFFFWQKVIVWVFESYRAVAQMRNALFYFGHIDSNEATIELTAGEKGKFPDRNYVLRFSICLYSHKNFHNHLHAAKTKLKISLNECITYSFVVVLPVSKKLSWRKQTHRFQVYDGWMRTECGVGKTFS